MAEMRPGKGDDDNRQQQRGNREQGIQDMVHHRRAQAVGRPGNHAQHQAKQRGAEGDDKSAADGGRRAAQQSACLLYTSQRIVHIFGAGAVNGDEVEGG